MLQEESIPNKITEISSLIESLILWKRARDNINEAKENTHLDSKLLELSTKYLGEYISLLGEQIDIPSSTHLLVALSPTTGLIRPDDLPDDILDTLSLDQVAAMGHYVCSQLVKQHDAELAARSRPREASLEG